MGRTVVARRRPCRARPGWRAARRRLIGGCRAGPAPTTIAATAGPSAQRLAPPAMPIYEYECLDHRRIAVRSAGAMQAPDPRAPAACGAAKVRRLISVSRRRRTTTTLPGVGRPAGRRVLRCSCGCGRAPTPTPADVDIALRLASLTPADLRRHAVGAHPASLIATRSCEATGQPRAKTNPYDESETHAQRGRRRAGAWSSAAPSPADRHAAGPAEVDRRQRQGLAGGRRRRVILGSIWKLRIVPAFVDRIYSAILSGWRSSVPAG